MRPLLLVLALLAAGCAAPEDLTTASTEESAGEPAPPPPPPTPEPRPVPTTRPPPSSAPPPPPSEPTPPTPPPPPPADHHHEQEGWVTPPAPPAATMTVRIPFPVEAGAANVTLRVSLVAVTPAGAPPAAPGNVTLSLVAPDGTTLATAQGPVGQAQPTATLEHAGPFTVGEHAAVLTLVGASDGQQAGHRYRALVHVAY